MYDEEEDDYVNPHEGNGAAWGCISVIFIAVLLGLILFIFKDCEGFKRKDPKTVTYREKVSETDSTIIYRQVEYKFSGVKNDTVVKKARVPSTLDLPTVKVQMFDDAVDLNDYLGSPDDDTDWNYTEIDDEQEEYIKQLGIYWDSKRECWRKK